jgi:hypothetical protein
MYVAGKVNLAYLAVDFRHFQSNRKSPLVVLHGNQAYHSCYWQYKLSRKPRDFSWAMPCTSQSYRENSVLRFKKNSTIRI